MKKHKKNCQCGMCKAMRGETKGKNNPHYGHYIYNITKKFLIREYIINKKSCKTIAKMVGCTAMTIYHKLKNYNIPTRTPNEACPWRGKKRPEHSKKMKGWKNPKVSEALKNKYKGKNASAYIDGRTNKIYYCIEKECNNIISYANWSKGNKRCKSHANRINMLGNIPWNKNKKCSQLAGKNNPMYGKIIKPSWGKYKNISMRSSWEIKYAEYLDKNNIKWEYESKTFDLGNTTYTPDFYLSEQNLYIEIKGYSSNVFVNKFKLFKKLYPKVKINVLREEHLKSMKVL